MIIPPPPAVITAAMNALTKLEGAERTSGHCKDCKWWVPDDNVMQTNYVFGGRCENGKLTECYGSSCYENDSLVYDYQEGGGFWTGPDFGCVHHEQKVESTQ